MQRGDVCQISIVIESVYRMLNSQKQNINIVDKIGQMSRNKPESTGFRTPKGVSVESSTFDTIIIDKIIQSLSDLSL